jgi:membrane-associated phospholipid phosphatase
VPWPDSWSSQPSSRLARPSARASYYGQVPNSRVPQTTDTQAADSLRQSPGRPRPALIAPGYRVAAGIVAVLGAAVMSLIAAAVAGHTRELWLDRVIDNRIMASPGHAGVAFAVAELGSPVSVTVIAVLVCLACLLTRRFRGAWLVAVTAPAVGLTDIGLKPLIHRTYAGFLSYPSGHTMGAFSMATVAVVLLLGPLHPPLRRGVRGLLAAAAALIGCAVALCLVVRRMHYFTDTVGGAALAIAMVLVFALVIDAVADRRGRAGRPAARGGTEPAA